MRLSWRWTTECLKSVSCLQLQSIFDCGRLFGEFILITLFIGFDFIFFTHFKKCLVIFYFDDPVFELLWEELG